MDIAIYVGPSGAKKAIEAGAVMMPDGLSLFVPLLSGPAKFKKCGRSFKWVGERDGAKSAALVDWLHACRIGFTYDCK